jgi:hypothetical protein
MNIMGLMNNAAPNSFSNKIAKRNEEKDIEKISDRIIDDALRTLSCKADFISKGLSYCEESSKITDDEKQELLKKLETQAKEIPEKLKKEIEIIFGGEETKEETKDNDEEKNKDNGAAVVIKTVETAPITPAPAPSMFGY